jgi:glyoxylase-like metal-dependent hydrolase (beta-lactamase superfamily II)
VSVEELAEHGVVRIRAANPGPFTLDGTNTWVVGAGPAFVVDPGPALAEHVELVARVVGERGGLGGIALTHDHADHSGAVGALRELAGPDAPVAAARGAVDRRLGDGDSFGPLRALATPGHSTDHLAFVHARVGFVGDAVLGAGSVFIAPDPGALAGYLDALHRLLALDLAVLCPGHGPPVHNPRAKLEAYVAHRLERERRLVDALSVGLRTEQELLDDVWADAPAPLRPAAAATLRAHLDKLSDEGRLPPGVRVRRPSEAGDGSAR